MDCREFEENIYAYGDGSLPSGLQAKLTLHLEKCQSCRQNYNFTLLETELLQEGGEVPDPPADLAARIINAIETGASPEPLSEPPSQPATAVKFSPPKSMYGLVAAAAIILALVVYDNPNTFLGNRTQVAVNDGTSQNGSNVPTGLTASEAGKSIVSEGTKGAAAPSASTVSKIPSSEIKATAPLQATNGLNESGNSTGPSLTTPSSVTATGPDTQTESSTDKLQSSVRTADLSAGDLSNYSPQNIPDGYVLEAVDSSGSGLMIYYYSNDAKGLNFRLELTTAANRASSVVKVFKYSNTTIYAYFYSNMPAEDLKIIANSMTIKFIGQ